MRASARSRRAALIVTAMVLLVLPALAGMWLSGRPVHVLLNFPPRPAPAVQPPFDAAVFAALAAPLALLGWWVSRRLAGARSRAPAPRVPGRLPWWGWAALAWTALFWWLAWTRQAWLEPVQPHSFTPLWLGFIVLVNALCQRRAGRCPMGASPGRFTALFGASAVFWWYFEYLNLVVGNWHYLGVDAFSDVEFFLFATLAFSTVLPAVLSARALLATFPVMHAAFVGLPRVRVRRPRTLAGLVLASGMIALFAVGFEPRWLFPMVWIAPLLVLEPLRVLWGEAPLLGAMGEGDWRALAHPALAALACGVFWEMWNHWSLARWSYTVPYVDSLHVFEMPLLGYAGYLPFGVECAVLGALVMGGPPFQARSHLASTPPTLC